jgi:hypothetical protein
MQSYSHFKYLLPLFLKKVTGIIKGAIPFSIFLHFPFYMLFISSPKFTHNWSCGVIDLSSASNLWNHTNDIRRYFAGKKQSSLKVCLLQNNDHYIYVPLWNLSTYFLFVNNVKNRSLFSSQYG